MGLCDDVRSASAAVMTRARSVAIDDGALEALLEHFEPEPASALPDPAHHFSGPPADVLAFVLTLDAVNFGSGWFPCLRKRPGLSGYFTIATSLKECFERNGPFSARALTKVSAADCAALFDQDPEQPGPAELMALFAQAWNELGAFLLSRYSGRFAGPLAEADGSAERIAEILGEMSLYRDVSRYDDIEVPFYKRAQLTVADLAAAAIGEQKQRLHGLEKLTSFADNLVPHVLRMEGVLRYAEPLAKAVEQESLIPAGSAEEIEIRAAGVQAVERMVDALAQRGIEANASALDAWLWNRGQGTAIKARPRHRTRTVYY